MAIAIDQTSLGVNNLDTNNTTLTLTTTATAASNSFIVMCCGWFLETTTLSTVSGGGLTWDIDIQGIYPGVGAAQSVAIVSAQAPSGLATSTVITCTFSGATQAKTIGAASFTGVKTSSALDTTATALGVNSTAWTTGSTSIAAGSLLVGTSWTEGAAASSTVTSPSTKNWDRFDVGDAYAQVAGYRIEASAGSYVVAGTWNAALLNTTIGAAYLAASGAAAPGPTRTFSPIPFMKRGQ